MVDRRPEVAVLLLNWRQSAATIQVCEDLRACGHLDHRVLVMDNGSGDGSVERIRHALVDETLLSFDDNLGYCAAMNRGLRWAAEARFPYVLFLNNDMRVPTGFLAPMVEAMRNDPSLSCVGPTILAGDGKVWSEGGRVGFHANTLWLCRHGLAAGSRTRGPVEVDFMPGACALYRLADLEAVGGLDEHYFMYVEDVDLGLRLKAAGKKILWLPWIEVTHEAGLSSGGGRTPLRKYMMAVNSLRLLRRHGSFGMWAALLIFDCLLWPLSLFGGEPRAALAKGRGLIAGLCGRRIDARVVDRYVRRSKA